MHRIVTTGVLSAALLLPAMALAPGAEAGHRHCLEPNGVDDTAALQSALESCTGARHRCIVSLCEGLFRIAPVRVGDFRGELAGAGRDKTVIQALPDLEVNDNPVDYFLDDPLDPIFAPWPFLLQFIEGKAKIHDLTIEVPTPEPGHRPTLGWLGGLIFELDGAVLLTGRHPVDFDVRRVRVVAGPDPGSDPLLNTTLLNGVYFQGRLFNPDDTGTYPVHPARGRYSLSDSELEGMLSGSPVAETCRAKITIRNNTYRSGFAMHVQDVSRSRLWILNNGWETELGGVQVLLNVDGDPSDRNSILALGNSGSTRVPFGDWGVGFYFLDPFDVARDPGRTALTLAHNDLAVVTADGPALAGIDVAGTGRLTVWKNVLRGQASLGGIFVDQTSGCRVISNKARTEGGPDLVLGLNTSRCLALVSRKDDVSNLGRGNWIIRR